MAKTISFQLEEPELEILWALRYLDEGTGPLGKTAGHWLRLYLRTIYEQNPEVRDAVEILQKGKASYSRGSDAPIRHLSLVR